MNVKSYILKLLVLPKSATFVVFALLLVTSNFECQTPPGLSIVTLQTPPGLSIVTLQTPPGL